MVQLVCGIIACQQARGYWDVLYAALLAYVPDRDGHAGLNEDDVIVLAAIWERTCVRAKWLQEC